MATVPSYLADYDELYHEDPHRAALAWFADARYGLFMHYGLYSLLGRHEWVQLREKIPVAEYAGLQAQFTAEAFDADAITDLAIAAGMRYVNITAKHHDGFCLFGSAESDFTSVAAPCGRDLVGELADACARKGLGFFAYYSLAADWKHPWFYAREAGWEHARPDYPTPEPTYRFRRDEDFRHYIDYVHAHLRELLTSYGPVAGIWFDPIMGYYQRPDLFPIEETYALIRTLQPHCLISFKQGANGDEDFASCERASGSLAHRLTGENAKVAEHAWRLNRDKHNEICTTMQRSAWGYRIEEDTDHRSADEVVELARTAWAEGSNLLLNTGPLPDGSIAPVDETALREAGRTLGPAGATNGRAGARTV